MSRHPMTLWFLGTLAMGMALTPQVVRAQAAAGEFLNEPYWVGDAVGAQWAHNICYNPDRNEYLLVFNNDYQVSYYVLDGTGAKQPDRPEVTVLDDPQLSGMHFAAVAYSSVSQRYLITYGGWLPSNSSQLRSHLVDANNGQLVRSNNLIYDGNSNIGDHEEMWGFPMAYSPTSDVHLVAWKDDKAVCDVYAAILSGATGQRTSTILNLSYGDTRYSSHPTIAWNSARDEFMVIYQVSCADVGQSWNFFGRRISAAGVMSERFQITNGTAPECMGGLAYDADLDRYLLAYEDTSAGHWVWGQFVTADGVVSGPRFDLYAAPYWGRNAWLTWHPVTRDFLVGSKDQNSNSDLGRRISQVGVPLGDVFLPTGSTAQIGSGNWDPKPVANPSTNEVLYAWFNSYNDVYTRRFKPLPMSDVTPPAPVTGFTATPGHGQVTLTWTNSTTSDCLGAIIRYKTTGFPTGSHDGLPLAVRPKSPGSSDTFVHTGLVRANTYYYAAFAYDAIPNHASVAQDSARPLAQADFDSDNDVDQKDFGHLQECFGGSGQPVPPGCDDADLDGEGDVDGDDLGVFIDCMSGANEPPGC
jgi:hypothetical protein